MGFRKGISPLVASVLLIAFTVAVAGLAAPWFNNLIDDIQVGTSEQTQTTVDASQASLELLTVEFVEETETLSGNLQNTGSIELTNFTITVFGDTPQQKQLNETLDVNDITTFELANVTGPETVRAETVQAPISTEHSLTENDRVNETDPDDDTDSGVGPEVGGDWTPVPGNSHFDTGSGDENRIYVMTYEAREDNTHPVSQPGGEPWTSISLENAINQCTALDDQTDSFDITLMTNREWMTIAHEIVQDESNWVDGEIGSTTGDGGGLVRGWSANTNRGDTWQNGAPPPDATQDHLYNTDQNHGDSSGDTRYRRTYTLPNEETIWDLSGSVWEWVHVTEDPENPGIQGGIFDGKNQFLESSASFKHNWSFTNAEDTRYELGPTDTTYGEQQAIGYIWNTDTDNRALRRGGDWASGPRAGPYSANTFTTTSTTTANTGFRCTATPPAK